MGYRELAKEVLISCYEPYNNEKLETWVRETERFLNDGKLLNMYCALAEIAPDRFKKSVYRRIKEVNRWK